VVLTLKCVFILIMVYFLNLRQNMKHSLHKWWKQYIILNTISVKNVLLFYNSVFPFPSLLQSFLILFGTRFEVLTVVTIHNVVWVMTPYSLLHGYECFAGALWAYLHRLSEDGGNMS